VHELYLESEVVPYEYTAKLCCEEFNDNLSRKMTYTQNKITIQNQGSKTQTRHDQSKTHAVSM